MSREIRKLRHFSDSVKSAINAEEDFLDDYNCGDVSALINKFIEKIDNAIDEEGRIRDDR